MYLCNLSLDICRNEMAMSCIDEKTDHSDEHLFLMEASDEAPSLGLHDFPIFLSKNFILFLAHQIFWHAAASWVKKREVGAVIVYWSHLHLPSSGPRFESQAHHLHLYNQICHSIAESTKINKKRPSFAHILRR